jgi:hypothetical protein
MSGELFVMIDDLRDFLRILDEKGKLRVVNNAH